MTFRLTHVSAPRYVVGHVRFGTTIDIREYLTANFPLFAVELFDETPDGGEIFIIIGNTKGHVRFHAERI